MTAHIPVRECILCRKKCAKSELIRVVKHEEGFFVDETQKKQGRGAYICLSCLNTPEFLKRRPLDRAFRTKVPDCVYDALKAKGE